MGNRVVLTFLNAGHFLIHYVMLIFPTAVIAIETEWGLSYGEALLFGTPGFVAFAIATLPAGWLGDRWDRRALLALFFLGCGASCLAVAAAPSGIGLMAGLAGIGLFAAIYHPVGLAMVTDLAARKGRALAINGVYGNLGLAAPALATGWLTVLFGWRAAFALPGVVCCLVGLAFLVFSRGKVQAGTHSDAAAHMPMAPLRATQFRVVAVVLVSALFGGCIFNGVTISLPKLFDERLAGGASNLGNVGTYVALVFALAAFAQLPVGSLLDRLGARPILLVLIAVQGFSLAVMSAISGPLLIGVALVLVIAMFAEIPITAWLLGQYISSEWRARAYAAEYTLSLGVSAAIVPLISTLHEQERGFGAIYLLMAAAAAVVTVAATFLPRSNRVGGAGRASQVASADRA